jgi:Zn-dependent M28 family amino/carboxypeptidase
MPASWRSKCAQNAGRNTGRDEKIMKKEFTKLVPRPKLASQRISRALLVAACGLLAVMTLAAASTKWKAAGQHWWAHVQYLAGDDLEGRNTGSAGYLKAAGYVAHAFQAAGLDPAGTDGYFQDVVFDVRQMDEEHSSLALVGADGAVDPLVLGEDAMLSARSDAGTSSDLPAAFVGYGFAVPELHFDELAGVDLHGKVAVYLAGAPDSLPEDLKAHYQSTGERYKALARAGAVGVAVILNPKPQEIPWARLAAGRSQPVMDIAEPALAEVRGMSVIATINPEHADRIFAGSGNSIAELLADASGGRPLPKFPLAVKIRANIAVKGWQAHSPNVVGRLAGSDPAMAPEFVVISAHLDHLGVAEPAAHSAVQNHGSSSEVQPAPRPGGQPGGVQPQTQTGAAQKTAGNGAGSAGHVVYSGAMDNAAGVASLIEIARWFHDTGTRPKRSLIFLAVTGEEKGELGSAFFCAHPTVELDKIVADLNMDMFLPLFPLKHLQVQGLGESTLGDAAREVARVNGVEAQSDLEPGANRFIRSDQYSFIRKGIPAVAFKFGYLPNTRENQIFYDFVHTRYHAPADNTSNPDINPVAAAHFDHLVAELALRVADAPARPAWHADSFFRRFAGAPVSR